MKIMIVDDSLTMHVFTKACLAKSGLKADLEAFDGEEAIRLLTSEVGLILLDWEMPTLNGPETVTKLRSMGVKVPIVMMTTRNSIEDISLMLNLGADDYIMKPFTADILFQKILPFLKGLGHDAAGNF